MDRRIGHLGPRKAATISDVARLAGVSKGAVSLALNGQPGVSEATRTRILGAARELQWRPSIHARALLRTRAFAIGLVIARDPELLAADPFYGAFLSGIESALDGTGYVLILQVVGAAPTKEAASYVRLAEESRIDGVVVIGLTEGDARLGLLERLSLPAVVVGPSLLDGPFPGLEDHDAVGVEQAIRHLAGLGHREIAFVGGTPGFLHTASRHRAWQETMHKLGLDARLAKGGDFTAAGGASATGQLLADRNPPTAIVYANDLMAIGGIATIRTAGLSVPDDVSIVGFDDIPLAGYVTPALTTVRQHVVAAGRAATRILLAVIDGGPLPDLRLEPPELIVRASTAPPSYLSPERAG